MKVEAARLTPAAISAGVSALNACISDAPRILPDEEIVERIYRAMQAHLDDATSRAPNNRSQIT